MAPGGGAMAGRRRPRQVQNRSKSRPYNSAMNPVPGSAAAKWSPGARRVARSAWRVTGAVIGADCNAGFGVLASALPVALFGASFMLPADSLAAPLAAPTASIAPLVTTFHITGVVVALVALVLGLVVAAALLWRAAWQLRRGGAELRDVRERLQCLDDLVDVWQWRTDTAHQLVWLRPPRGIAGVMGSGATSIGTALWDQFKARDEAALRARLASHAPLDAIAVQHAGAPPPQDAHADATDATAAPLLHVHLHLHGRIRTDAYGRFAGYQGVLRARDDAAAGAPVAAATIATAPATTDIRASSPQANFESDHEAFSFTVSHDLRAPIRVVEGFTKIVKEDYGRLLDRIGNEHLDRVLGAAARMNNMIDALLALARLASQPLACQPVDLSQLAGFVADDLRREWPDKSVTLDIAPAMRVQGDPTLLRIVLENLLGNAWKYSARTATPHISFRPQNGSADVFTVSDNGAGFDMRFADRLFGVFQRLHSATDFPGSGVGLASVRRIVRRHGGDVWGEGEVGRGAKFHFSLPQRPLNR